MHKCEPHGQGIWKEQNGIFEGEFEHGDFVHGTITYADGSVYKGDMKNGVRMGANSEFIFNDGEKFTGEFDSGQGHLGHGTVKKSDGTSYQGDLN